MIICCGLTRSSAGATSRDTSWNAKMRQLLGFDLPYPMAGEKVLCLKNAHRHGIYNGCVYTLAHNFEPDDTTICLDIDGVALDVPKAGFVGEGGSLDDFDDDDFTR